MYKLIKAESTLEEQRQFSQCLSIFGSSAFHFSPLFFYSLHPSTHPAVPCVIPNKSRMTGHQWYFQALQL